MSAYEIAKYLPAEARRAAAQEHYPWDEVAGYPLGTFPYCPLGCALIKAGCPPNEVPGWPTAEDVVYWLSTMGIRGDDIVDAASAFMNDWDFGWITNLAEALGAETRPLGAGR